MQRFLGYNSQTDSFEELPYPQNITGWEYRIYFMIWNDNSKDHQAQHYVYCRNFNDLSVVLGKLSPILRNEGVHANYTYVREEQTREHGTQPG